MVKLFLAAEFKHPKTVQDFSNYIGGVKDKSIAYIPTAANGESWQCWKDGGTWKLFQTFKTNIALVQLEDYKNRNPIKDLVGKDIIFFAGGSTSYLLYWMRRTKLDVNLKSILNKGSIYVGSSAGCMATGKDINFIEWYIGEPEYGAGCIPGLGLVDFNFYPHYEDKYYDEIKSKYTGKKMYLVKNGESIIVENKKIKVIGKERTICK